MKRLLLILAVLFPCLLHSQPRYPTYFVTDQNPFNVVTGTSMYVPTLYATNLVTTNMTVTDYLFIGTAQINYLNMLGSVNQQGLAYTNYFQAQSNYFRGSISASNFTGNGFAITNIPGSGLQSASLNSNRFDAGTLALFGSGGTTYTNDVTGLGLAGVITGARIGTNTTNLLGTNDERTVKLSGALNLTNAANIVRGNGTTTNVVTTASDVNVTGTDGGNYLSFSPTQSTLTSRGAGSANLYVASNGVVAIVGQITVVAGGAGDGSASFIGQVNIGDAATPANLTILSGASASLRLEADGDGVPFVSGLNYEASTNGAGDISIGQGADGNLKIQLYDQDGNTANSFTVKTNRTTVFESDLGLTILEAGGLSSISTTASIALVGTGGTNTSGKMATAYVTATAVAFTIKDSAHATIYTSPVLTATISVTLQKDWYVNAASNLAGSIIPW